MAGSSWMAGRAGGWVRVGVAVPLEGRDSMDRGAAEKR